MYEWVLLMALIVVIAVVVTYTVLLVVYVPYWILKMTLSVVSRMQKREN